MNLPAVGRKAPAQKEIAGVDIFLHWHGTDAMELGEAVKALDVSGMSLSMISNRGIMVWPKGFPETYCTDHWRLRYKPAEGNTINHQQIVAQLNAIMSAGYDFIKTENLVRFNGKDAYSLGQGQ